MPNSKNINISEILACITHAPVYTSHRLLYMSIIYQQSTHLVHLSFLRLCRPHGRLLYLPLFLQAFSGLWTCPLVVFSVDWWKAESKRWPFYMWSRNNYRPQIFRELSINGKHAVTSVVSFLDTLNFPQDVYQLQNTHEPYFLIQNKVLIKCITAYLLHLFEWRCFHIFREFHTKILKIFVKENKRSKGIAISQRKLRFEVEYFFLSTMYA